MPLHRHQRSPFNHGLHLSVAESDLVISAAKSYLVHRLSTGGLTVKELSVTDIAGCQAAVLERNWVHGRS